MLGKADRVQRARGRLPRSTAAGDDTLRNRIEPMHRAKKDAAEAVGEAAGVCRHNESQRWLDMRVGSPEDCCRDPPVVTQPPTSSATEESEGAPPLTAGLAAHRPTKHPLEHLYKYKYKGDLLQVVNTPGGSGKTLALATLLAEQEEIRSRSATWQQVEGHSRLKLGADPDFAKYFAKYALPAGREKFPEISPVWGLELHQTP